MNNISLKLASDILHATTKVERAIAELRSLAIVSVEVPYGSNLTLVIPPANDDDRVVVKSVGQGFTCVNYGSEGLIVDVYGEDQTNDNMLVHTAAIETADLRQNEETQPAIDPEKTVTVVVPARACDEHGEGPSAASITVNAKLLKRLTDLRELQSGSGNMIEKIVTFDSPEWLPSESVEPLRLHSPELVVTARNFWFEDTPKHSNYHVECDIIEFDELFAAFNSAADGETVVLGNDDFKEEVADMLAAETEQVAAHG